MKKLFVLALLILILSGLTLPVCATETILPYSNYTFSEQGSMVIHDLQRDCDQNGIENTYKPKPSFHIELEYSITNDGFKVYVDTKKITYNPDYKPCRIEILPYFGAGVNNVEIPDSTLTMNEYNFGVFYEADYYGRFMPKPAAIAFAVMTQQLESINKNSAEVFDKYDEGYDVGGVRAFKCTTATDGEVVIAYSNSEVLSNGKKGSDGKTGLRTPNLPWNNQWSKTDATKFQTKGDKATVVDIMGNTTEYKAQNGYVTIPLTGSPVYIYGVK